MLSLRWPYPDPPKSGFWGETTAIIDWCEENYVVSPYIAEFSNTITNSVFVITAFYSTYCAYASGLEKRFLFIGFGFGLVGFGSWLFHMTLKYRFQLLDELPMLLATCVPAWSVFCEFDWKELKRSKTEASLRKQITTGLIISTFVAGITWFYIVYRIPVVFQILYGVLTCTVVFMSGSFAYFLSAQDISEEDEGKLLIKRNLYTTMAIGVVVFLLGFIFWQLDLNFCPFWIYVRRTYLKLPLGILLELHGWWHLFTGIGVYTYIVFLQYLRVLTRGCGQEYTFIWRWGVLPELIRKDLAINTKYSLTFRGDFLSEKNGSVENINYDQTEHHNSSTGIDNQ